MNLKVTGTAQTLGKLEKLSAAMASAKLEAAVLAGAQVVVNRAKEKAPVKTGNLRRSIHSSTDERSPTKASVLVGTNVEYAPYLEFGTRRMSARPYLRPAFDETKGEVQRVIQASLAALLEGVR